ncbi:382_t:CDS:2, partial [Acaulospora morrowiae]
RQKRESEKRLVSQIEELENKLKERDRREAEWYRSRNEANAIIEDLRSKINDLSHEKDFIENKLLNLQQDFDRSQQEVKTHSRMKKSTDNLIAMFQQKTEETIRDMNLKLNEKTKECDESAILIEVLKEQLNDINKELSDLRVQFSDIELEYNESKEHCEDLKSLLGDKKDIISRLEQQLDRIKADGEEHESNYEKDTQDLKKRLTLDREQALASLRTKLETLHQKELQDLKVQHEQELASLRTKLEASHQKELQDFKERHETDRGQSLISLRAEIELPYKEEMKVQKERYEKDLIRELTLLRGELESKHQKELKSIRELQDKDREQAINLVRAQFEDSHKKKLQDLMEKHNSDQERTITSLRAQLKTSHQKELQDIKERNDAERDQLMISFRKELEASHEIKLQEHADRLRREYETKISNLNSRYEDLSLRSARNSESSKELEEAESKYTKLNSEYLQLLDINKQLSDKTDDLNVKVKELELKNSEIQESAIAITSEKERAKDELLKVNEELKQLKEKTLVADSDLKELEAERDKLAGLISVMKEVWEVKYQELQNKYVELEAQKEQLSVELSPNVKSEMDDKLKEYEAAINNASELEKQRETLSKLLEEHQNGMRTCMAELAAEREAWRQREEDLISVYEGEFKEKNSELQDNIESLEAHINVLKEQSHSIELDMQNRLDKSNAEIEELRKKLQEKGWDQPNLTNLSGESATSASTIEFLTRKVEEYEVGRENLEAQIESLNNKFSDMVQERDSIMKSFEESTIRMEKTVQGHRQRIEDMKKTHEEEKEEILYLHQTSIKSLKEKHEEEFTQHSVEMQSQIESLERRVRELMSIPTNNAAEPDAKVILMKQNIENLGKQLKSSREECEMLIEKVLNFQNKFSDATYEKEVLIKEKSELRQKLKSMEAENIGLHEKIKALEAESEEK